MGNGAAERSEPQFEKDPQYLASATGSGRALVISTHIFLHSLRFAVMLFFRRINGVAAGREK
jgi:hypothetical protein